ncbi:MAG: ankyrin repeat domain-containing protein [Simkaniaceae bacterium]|nr:ankyrin repeat domain-containing protein [Simkaniaceae bacterium]
MSGCTPPGSGDPPSSCSEADQACAETGRFRLLRVLPSATGTPLLRRGIDHPLLSVRTALERYHSEVALRVLRGEGGRYGRVGYADPTSGVTLLMYAAGRGWVKSVDTLIAAGADPDRADVFGRTAIIYATCYGRLAVVKKLVEHGAEIPGSGSSPA